MDVRDEWGARLEARTAELEASREKAQTALNDYLEVLGFVAHELKSPLAGAKMQLQHSEPLSEVLPRP
ncbi:MAG TPA: hypothetical protein VF332_01855 [Vicinamibacterales bacterium]